MMVLGATRASADDVDLGLPPARRLLSSSVDGPLGNGRRRGGEGRDGAAAAAVPETVVLTLGNFQGVVVLDMGLVTVRSCGTGDLQHYRTQQTATSFRIEKTDTGLLL